MNSITQDFSFNASFNSYKNERKNSILKILSIISHLNTNIIMQKIIDKNRDIKFKK